MAHDARTTWPVFHNYGAVATGFQSLGYIEWIAMRVNHEDPKVTKECPTLPWLRVLRDIVVGRRPKRRRTYARQARGNGFSIAAGGVQGALCGSRRVIA